MSSTSGSAALLAESALPPHEAVRLLMAVTGVSRLRLITGTDVSGADADRFRVLVVLRRSGEPLQYLETTAPFGPLELKADRRALIPRPETELLWEMVTHETLEPPAVVVDLCTGSGNLALACKLSWPTARVFATDLSAPATELARENSQLTGHAVEVLEGDLFDPLPLDILGRVDIVVANPPYLARAELATLPDDVRLHEPEMALVAGAEGTEILERIANEAVAWLRPGGRIACEISEFHPDRVAALFARYMPEIRNDLAGRPRFVFGRAPAPDAK